jgi:uncharacterized damage-inducible protein DinB
MILNIINQLKFARSEFKKGFNGVSEKDGRQRLVPINSIGWIVGHLAWHEQYYWLTRAQGKILIPEIIDQVGFGKPASTPSLKKMNSYWEKITRETDDYLCRLEESDLLDHMIVEGKELPFNIGTMISRVIYHYWYHNGEMQALRQLMGHSDLPEFVSDDIETIGSYYLD